MNIFFLFIWRLRRLNDQRFVYIWETRYLKHMRTIITVLFLLYLFIILLVGQLFSSAGFLTGLMAVIVTGIVLGYYMLVHALKFFAIENTRYFEIKTRYNGNGIDYDNVVN